MSMLAVDFETALIQPGLQLPPPVCMSAHGSPACSLPLGCYSAAYDKRVGYVLLAEDGLDLLESHLRLGGSLVGLNTPFDLGVACNARPSVIPLVLQAYDEDRITDVVVRQKLIDIAMGYDAHDKYSMQDMAWRLLDRYIEKEGTWRGRYWELVDTPLTDWPMAALEYSAGDAVITLDLYSLQEEELAAVDRLCVLADQYRQSRADFVLRLCSAWGLRSDPDRVRSLREACEKGVADLLPVLEEKGLLKAKYKGRKPHKIRVGTTKSTANARLRILLSAVVENTPEDQRAALLDALARVGVLQGEGTISLSSRKVEKEKQLKVLYQAAAACAVDPWKQIKITDTGIKKQRECEAWRDIKYVAADKEACRDCDDPVMQDFTKYSQLENMITGFIKAIEKGAREPIHSRFEVLLATGRTSSSEPNVQNVRSMEGSRECFVPREGHVYIGCDIDRAELHTLAQCCIDLFGRSTLGDTLNAGIDPHTKFGARLAGCSYDELRSRVAAEDETAKGLRKRAKPANFGLPGGMGAKGLRAYAKGMYGVILTADESQGLVDSWREEYPDIAGDYLGWVKRLVGRGAGTIEHFGSHRWRGDVGFCQAANSFFQGRAADALKQALWELLKKCLLPGGPLHGCHIANEVHDEVILEAPIDQANDAAREMQSTMRDAYNRYTPDVPVACTPVVMDCWSKKAIPLVSNGVYNVWSYDKYLKGEYTRCTLP